MWCEEFKENATLSAFNLKTPLKSSLGDWMKTATTQHKNRTKDLVK